MNTNDLMKAFTTLVEAARDGSVEKKVADKVLDPRLTCGKSRKGAKHKQGKVFKSVKYLMLTPAQYRRSHFANTIKGAPKDGYPRYY